MNFRKIKFERKVTVDDIMKLNLQRKFDSNLISESQFSRVSKTIKLIEKSPIASRKISDVTADEIQKYMNSIEEYSNSYIKKVYEQFTQAYRFAISKQYIKTNPMLDVVRPKSKKKDKVVRSLTIEEQKKLTDYLISKSETEEKYKNVYLMQMYMGLRIGEVLALTVDDIDCKNNIINVSKTLTVNKEGKTIVGESTKTYAGMREIPIKSNMKQFIKSQINIAEKRKRKELFLEEDGGLVDSKNVNKNLKKIAKKELSKEDITTHSLRHTYGTRCIESGMNPVAVQKLMGHTDVTVTLNIYTTVFNKYKVNELKKLDNYYSKNMII